MRNLWNRLENWLEQNAPDILANLNPGASLQEIEAIQNILGELPEDYIASCLIHNGQKQESPGLIPSGVGSIGGALIALGVSKDSSFHTVLGEWTMLKELYDSDPFFREEGDRLGNAIKNRWWVPRWIPITSSGGGDYDCLDLDPGEDGEWGQIITFYHDAYADQPVQTSSFRAWLEQIVEGLEQGSIVNDEEQGLISRDELSKYRR